MASADIEAYSQMTQSMHCSRSHPLFDHSSNSESDMTTIKSLIIALLLIFPAANVASAQNGLTRAQAIELATLDAVATMVGSTQSWIRNEPEAAIHLFSQQKEMLSYLNAKRQQYSGQSASGRIADRIKQLEQSIKHWNDTIPRYKAETPKQIATELKRQRDAVARYKKAKRPRPSSFTYIPKTVWETKNKLDVLTASRVDTKDLQQEQKEVQKLVHDLLNAMDVAELAKSTNTPRDAYARDDRAAIEQFVSTVWKTQHPDLVAHRIVMPAQSWSNTYGATVDETSKKIIPREIDRMTVYVMVKNEGEVATLYPVRLMRKNFNVHGKLLNKSQPQAISQISTNEFPFVVLSCKIRER